MKNVYIYKVLRLNRLSLTQTEMCLAQSSCLLLSLFLFNIATEVSSNAVLDLMFQAMPETVALRGRSQQGYEAIHEFLHTSYPYVCRNTHTLKGENNKEPDVNICLDSIEPGCVVYSFGIANNWIFDDFMIEQGCEVFSFDPSMEGVTKHKRHPNHLFEPIGIGTVDGIHTGESTLYGKKKNYEVDILDHLMKRHGHTHLTLVRMDVESAEWDVLEQWIDKGWVQRMDQLLLEVHLWKTSDEQRHSQILHNIPMTLFHTAKNHWNNVVLSGDMTQVYELGLMATFNQIQAPGKFGAVKSTTLLTPTTTRRSVINKHT